MSYNFGTKNDEGNKYQLNLNLTTNYANNIERVSEDDAINIIANKLNEQSLVNGSLGDLSKLYVGKLNNGSIGNLKLTALKQKKQQNQTFNALNAINALNQTPYYQIKQFEQDVNPNTTTQMQQVIAAENVTAAIVPTPESIVNANLHEGYASDHPGFYVRYAVNGLSKTEPNGNFFKEALNPTYLSSFPNLSVG